MKNLINKVRHHGKKITIHLKRHHRKYLFGALCSGILALIAVHTVSTINNIFANEEPIAPSITYDSWANIIYTDTNWREFTWIGTITISNWVDSITMLDRNLWATTNDINDTWSYWYHFQRWNNYGFEIWCREDECSDGITQSAISGETVDTSEYWPWNYYTWSVFRILSEFPYDWSNPKNDNLRWGSWDNAGNNRWYPVNNTIDRQWPCPDWYHVPSRWERWTLFTYWISKYTWDWNELNELEYLEGFPEIYSGNDAAVQQFREDFKISFAGFRRENSAQIDALWDHTSLWSSSTRSWYSNYFFVHTSQIIEIYSNYRTRGKSVRCFKNTTPALPYIEFFADWESIWSWTVVSWTIASGIRPSDPQKSGYAFSWWYESGASESFNFNTVITWDLNLYAKRIKTYQVNFINSGTIISSWTVVSWSTASWIKPSDPQKSGYDFSWWYESGSSEAFDFNTPIAEDLDLYAMWTEIITNQVFFIDSGTIIASWAVVSWSTASWIKPSDPQKSGYIFSWWYESGASVLFDFTTPITGDLNLYALWMEIITNQVFFIDSGTIITSWTVVSWSTATWIKPSDPQKSGYTFSWWYESGASVLFDFNTPIVEDLDLYALWIDVPPTCNVIYNITWWTNQNVTATITWCSEAILWSLSHVFTGNWTYTFEFQDLVGNTWTANATVNWITDNTTYINVEWYQFSWNDLTICNSNNSRECITMMDRNLWATTNDTTKTWSYGYKYQWWNNYWFKDWCWVSTWCSDNITSWALSIYASWVEWRNIYNNSWYYWKVFIKWGLNSYWSDYKVHNHLWWWWNDNSWSNWWYPVSNPADRQWPCPDWYHVPSAWERSKVVWRWIERSNTWVRAQWYKGTVSSSRFLNWIFDNSWSYAFHNDFNIPLAGIRSYYDWSLWEFWENTSLWTSSAPGNESIVVSYYFDWRSHVEAWKWWSSQWNHWISDALPIRCFKNNTWYHSSNTWNNTWKYFSIIISNTVNAWEYTDFTVKVIKNWQIYRNYAGSVFFEILDSDWNILKDYNLYSLPNNERYDFEVSDYWKKTFRNWLRINKAWTYKLLVIDLFEGNFLWSVTFVVRWNHSSANVTYNTSKFDSKYSDEMNRAYQYARYYKITTKDTIREANMYSGLTRVAMAKMLTNYAENVLGINDFDTSKNCKFKDVSNALDKQYDYWVTKACQLGIMWVNMKNNNFNPYDPVTRAQFATALSRLLFLTKDWTDKYYSTHISKLQRDKIITNTDPTLKELRWYVMLMLMRVWK